MVELLEHAQRVPPDPGGGLGVARRMVGVTEVGERVGLEVAVTRFPEQVDGVLVADDGIVMVPEVVVGEPEAVRGQGLTMTVSDLLVQRERLLAQVRACR